jgi:hypothetical protein
MRNSTPLWLTTVSFLTLAACKEETRDQAKATLHNAGETIQMAARDVDHVVTDAAPEIKAKLERAGDKIEETTKEAARGTKDAIKAAGRKTDRELRDVQR